MGASSCEKYHTSLPEYGGLETHPDGGPSGRHQELVYLPKLHPVARASDSQSHPVRELIRSLIYEPPSPILLEGLEEVKGLLKEGTPVSIVWEQLSQQPLLQGQQRPVEGRTIRDWRLSLTQAKRCDNCQCALLDTCLGCGLSRCGVRTCNAFCETCGTCQTTPIKVDLKPPPRCTKVKRKIISHPMSLNLHAVGLHFMESITGIEEIPDVDPALSEEEEQPLTNIRFRASVRG